MSIPSVSPDSDVMRLIGEFSGDINFLPAVSAQLAEKGLNEEAEKVSILAAKLAPEFAMASLLADEEEADKAPLENKAMLYNQLVEKYKELATSHPLLKGLPAAQEIIQEINRIQTDKILSNSHSLKEINLSDPHIPSATDLSQYLVQEEMQ
ncbi:MAG: hypothetical protein COT84_03060 [Chlamydiae bacterium CG10_big_fil_rev_8_21_14_0_10_35_9]|nr:MAG: hypothetical protein COT84_03060 [Chlamydiae bacterium CG10_big_fil_rev_8_21_14_0_10_35_9]